MQCARAVNAQKTREALVQLGMAYRRADAYEEATACLTEALAESRALNDERHAADTLYHLGTVAWSTGLNDQAIGFHQQAVEICERTGLADLVAVQAYHGRGEAHFANAEPAAAIECYTRSLELARGIGDKSYESENLMMIGHACVGTKGLGDYPRATANFEAALEIARAADLQWHLGPTLLGLDHVRACIGRYGEAWSGMRETLRWLESLRQTRYQLIAYDFIGHLLLDLGLNELAVEQLEHGLALGRDTGIMFWRAAIDAHVCVARSRLGEQGVAPASAGHARTDAPHLGALFDGPVYRRVGGDCARGGRREPLPRVRGRIARDRASRTACASSRRARGAGAARLCSPRKLTRRRRQSCRVLRRWRRISAACACRWMRRPRWLVYLGRRVKARPRSATAPRRVRLRRQSRRAWWPRGSRRGCA